MGIYKNIKFISSFFFFCFLFCSPFVELCVVTPKNVTPFQWYKHFKSQQYTVEQKGDIYSKQIGIDKVSFCPASKKNPELILVFCILLRLTNVYYSPLAPRTYLKKGLLRKFVKPFNGEFMKIEN